MKILALLGSTRQNGNSQYLTEKMLEGTNHTMVSLSDKQINSIRDERHAEGGFNPVDDDYKELLDLLIAHDTLIFSTPLYWYGMSGPMKNFFDRWSQYLRDENMNLKEELAKKKAYVVVTGGSSAKVKGLPLIQQFSYIFDFVNMEFVDYLIGSGVKPGEVREDRLALEKAEQWRKEFQA